MCILHSEPAWVCGSKISPRCKFGRTFSINNRARHGDVWKLLPIPCATQHQAPATHVTTTDKVRWESQPVAKSRQQNIHVLTRRNAATNTDRAFEWYHVA